MRRGPGTMPLHCFFISPLFVTVAITAPGTAPTVVAKIRHLQHRLMLTDLQLFGLVHSYGPLTDSECKKLLDCSIRGTGISGYAYGY